MAAEIPQFPNEVQINLTKAQDLRYGENPHQKGAIYFEKGTNSPLKNLQLLAGRESSLVNVTDVNAGVSVVRLFEEPSAVVIKHNNPCGIALGEDGFQALTRAIDADSESAFGGIIVLNRPLDEKVTEAITAFKDERRGNIDVVAAPTVTDEALAILKKTRKSMAVYQFGQIPQQASDLDYKRIDGGFIVQEADQDIEGGFESWRVATEVQPTEEQMAQMKIAWKFITRIKSNSVIVVDSDLPMTRGIGTGQTSRVRATDIALRQASNLEFPLYKLLEGLDKKALEQIRDNMQKEVKGPDNHARGAILASDSFFPFPDSVEKAALYKIGAKVQQGGSLNDQASIDAANRAGIPMVMTGRRAFWH